MEKQKKYHSCSEINQTDMVDYLASAGFKPVKIRNADYWYRSPLRNEKTASFKVNRKINCWYDHGIGKGGTFIDFAVLFHQCSVSEFLKAMSEKKGLIIPVQSEPKTKATITAIRVIKVEQISQFELINYLANRFIPIKIASLFCQQITYEFSRRQYVAIGFKNDEGGYELRNRYYKNSSSPKSPTWIKNGGQKLAVFEGFFDFLSFIASYPDIEFNEWDFYILNSLSFFEKLLTEAAEYKSIYLYLDNDPSGRRCTEQAVLTGPKYIDQASLYSGYKDLNAWRMMIGKG